MVMDPLPESEKESDDKEENSSLSNAELFRKLALLKLKLVASYAMDGFAPAVAVVAVIVSVVAMNGNKADQAQLKQNAASIESMKASLLASKAELEKFKGAMSQEKAIHEEERKKQDARMMQIIQSVSKLQVKMKISPTLEEQLHQPVSRSEVTPSVVAVPAVSITSPAATSTVSAMPGKAASAPAQANVSTGTDKKHGTQVQVLKEAIEKFNKK